MKIKIKLFNGGILPVYKHKADACADCFSAGCYTIPPGARLKVALGFGLELPKNYKAVIFPRSGLSSDGIDVLIGTIDSGYTGEIMANILNNSDKPFVINHGERVCQIGLEKVHRFKFKKVLTLAQSERGSNGFGSTGK